jgi:beta-hydroxylase
MRLKNEMQHTKSNWFLNKVRTVVEMMIRLADGDKTFYDHKNLTWIKMLEDNYKVIQGELLNVMNKIEIPAWQKISDDPNVRVGDDWKTFVLYAYGNKIEGNCRLCPETTRLIERVPEFYTAWFSILAPRKKIPEHRGPYNGVLRYHLGLKIPKDYKECGIRVGNDYATWKEGESILFDDSHLHEVWNNTDEVRVILFMDVLRPLPWGMNAVNKRIIKFIGKSSFIEEVVKKANVEK